MRFGFIGAGKVGFSFGKYLCLNGVNVSGYYSKNPISSLEASNFTKTNQYLNLNDLVENSDAICITTPDKEILNVWDNLKQLSIKNKLICHCSGALSSEIFSDISKFGAYSYSIHPMFALSDKYNSYKKFNEAFITIEGDEKYINKLEEIFKTLGNSYKVINKENKSLYHLASVMSSNLVLGLINCGLNYLKLSGFDDNEAMEALYPLIKNNIENIRVNGCKASLTGPLERGDLNTIKSHIDAMPAEDVKLYKVCNENLLKLAKEKNEDRNYSLIEDFLKGRGENEKYGSNI